jgi:hypothetical protein
LNRQFGTLQLSPEEAAREYLMDDPAAFVGECGKLCGVQLTLDRLGILLAYYVDSMDLVKVPGPIREVRY